ncbi:SGNH/GDSL hydrolase family protein [Corynebacterium qintianiae]|uniref:SGNH/GDSL hydrolase family protein n=1 Tax=Corynebacterium qintianiae TaxID=2709392 RepID=UPI0013EBB501|nr:SGNH/GDSL hydrolase family protein [Corynebacterium qintianiae]
MTTSVSGPLRLVTDQPASLVQVMVRAPRPRPYSGGMVVDFTTPASVTEGVVSFPCVPGPAVLSVMHAGVPQITVPLVVPDKPSASLDECMRAAELADKWTLTELERLAQQIAKDVSDAGALARDLGGIDGIAQTRTALEEAAQTTTDNAQSVERAKTDTIDARDEAVAASSTATEQAGIVTAQAAEAQNNATKAAQSEEGAETAKTEAERHATAASTFATNAANSLAQVTPTAQQAMADYIDSSDFSPLVEQARIYAEAAQSAEASGAAWDKGTLTAELGSLNNAPVGVSKIATTSVAQSLGTPNNVPGTLRTVEVGSWKLQHFESIIANVRRSWKRHYNGASWTSWVGDVVPDQWQWGNAVYASNVGHADTAPKGFVEVWSGAKATELGMPTADLGVFFTFTFGNAGVQWWVPLNGPTHVRKKIGGAWQAWENTDEVSLPAPSGTKRVPLAVTAPGGLATQSKAAGSARWVRTWAHKPIRARLHVVNANVASRAVPGSTGDALTLLGVKVGVATLDGTMTNAVEVVPNGTTVPGNLTGLTSHWFEVPGSDRDPLGITLAWQGGGVQQLFQGGGWISDSTSGWDGAAPLGGMSKMTPLHVWVEAEVPAHTPVVVVNGDSISIGTAADNPVTDSWVAQYCLSENALPVIYSQHGSQMSAWYTGTARWDIYQGLHPSADAVIAALGQNDLIDTTSTLQQLQDRYKATRQAHELLFPGVPVYAAGVTASSKAPKVEAVRRAYNDWLKTQPVGESGYIDLPRIVGDSGDEDLKPEYSADGIHPNTAGQTAMAGELIAHPVTKFVATSDDLRKLQV